MSSLLHPPQPPRPPPLPLPLPCPSPPPQKPPAAGPRTSRKVTHIRIKLHKNEKKKKCPTPYAHTHHKKRRKMMRKPKTDSFYVDKARFFPPEYCITSVLRTLRTRTAVSFRFSSPLFPKIVLFPRTPRTEEQPIAGVLEETKTLFSTCTVYEACTVI